MTYKQEYRNKNRDKINQQQRDWRKRDLEKHRAYNRAYYYSHLDQEKNKRLKNRYGITLMQYNKMFEDQSGRCAICVDEVKKLYVDHNHWTGKVRGLLCMNCNCLVGQYERKPDIAENLEAYVAGSFCRL